MNACAADGAHLVTFVDQTENDYVVSNLGSGAWIGGSDVLSEGDWVWYGGENDNAQFWLGDADGSAQNTLYTNWDLNEPGNSGNEDCLKLVSGGPEWNDDSCRDSNDYICEIDSYGSGTLFDMTPDPFSFTNVAGVTPDYRYQESNIVQITGIDAAIVSGGAYDDKEYRICSDATCSANPGWHSAGQSITSNEYLQLRVRTATTGSKTFTVNVGDYSADWEVTSRSLCPDPDIGVYATHEYGVDNITLEINDNNSKLVLSSYEGNSNPASWVISGPSTPSSLTAVSYNKADVSGFSWTNYFNYSPDNNIALAGCGDRPGTMGEAAEWAACVYSVSVDDVCIIDVEDNMTYQIGTPPDWTPNNFSFTDQSLVSTSTLIESNIERIDGIDNGVPVSISGDGNPEYRICADSFCSAVNHPWASSSGSIDDNEYLQLRLTSNASFEVSHTAKITVGTSEKYWKVTTGTFDSSCKSGAIAPGDACDDGSIYAGISPDGDVPMYTTPSDQSSAAYWGANAFYTDSTSSITGESNTADVYAHVMAGDGNANPGDGFTPNAFVLCSELTDYGHNDWYLPASEELRVLHNNRFDIGGFAFDYYWSSREASSGFYTAMRVYMQDGNPFQDDKDQTNYVRCVRK
ncbi:hypothetical protein GCM10027428_35520 [Haliea atlantica]